MPLGTEETVSSLVLRRQGQTWVPEESPNGFSYVSNVSIIFDCSMLLYYLFWMFMGFTLHFYIIFGTNLLTGGPARIAVFFANFSVSKERNIKRSPNGMKPLGT